MVVLAIVFPFVNVSAGNSLNNRALSSPSSQSDFLEAALAINPVSLPRGGGGPLIIEGNTLVLDSSPMLLGEDYYSSDIGQISVYVVRPGDTLSQIADMFEVSAKTIIWANDLPSNYKIRPGDNLVILPISGVRHLVKKGDTVESIAKNYKGEVEEIVKYNNLVVGEKLIVGSEIIIPHGVVPEPARSSSPVRSSSSLVRSSLVRPISGGVKTQGLHGFNAVDLAAPIGTPVYASASGEVVIARFGGWNGGYGNYIVIRHTNGVQTLYAHLSSVQVQPGQQVSAGQLIGAIGSTGRSTGPHIHFEVRGAVNPF